MRLGAIILRLRAKNTYFQNFIGGSAELEIAIKNTLKKDMAFVIPLLDEAQKNEYDTTYNQRIIERFGVVVALANDQSQDDKLGFLAYDKLHNIRNEFLAGLCSWIPQDAETTFSYRGGKFIDVTGAYLWYQFEFDFESRISQESSTGIVGVQSSNFDDSEVPVPFNTIYMQLINTPDARIPYENMFGEDGEMPYPDGYPDVILPNMANWIDLTENPNAGAFSNGFHSGFDVYFN